MDKSIKVSILIVSFNTKKLLVDCIESIYTHTTLPFEIIVVDNDSKDGSVAAVRKLNKKEVTILSNKSNVGFAKANNQAITLAKGKYLLLLNSDTILTEDSIGRTVEYLEQHSAVGIASCKLLNPDGSIQPTGGYFPTLPRMFFWMSFIDDIPFVSSFVFPFHPSPAFYKQARSLDWVTGAFFCVRAQVIRDIGGLDEDYFMYVEELDFCYRAKTKGWSVGYIPSTSIIHFGRASSTNEFAILSEYKNLQLFYTKHFQPQARISRLLLKFGAITRRVLFAILGRPVQSRIYAKAFSIV